MQNNIKKLITILVIVSMLCTNGISIFADSIEGMDSTTNQVEEDLIIIDDKDDIVDMQEDINEALSKPLDREQQDSNDENVDKMQVDEPTADVKDAVIIEDDDISTSSVAEVYAEVKDDDIASESNTANLVLNGYKRHNYEAKKAQLEDGTFKLPHFPDRYDTREEYNSIIVGLQNQNPSRILFSRLRE